MINDSLSHVLLSQSPDNRPTLSHEKNNYDSTFPLATSESLTVGTTIIASPLSSSSSSLLLSTPNLSRDSYPTPDLMSCDTTLIDAITGESSHEISCTDSQSPTTSDHSSHYATLLPFANLFHHINATHQTLNRKANHATSNQKPVSSSELLTSPTVMSCSTTTTLLPSSSSSPSTQSTTMTKRSISKKSKSSSKSTPSSSSSSKRKTKKRKRRSSSSSHLSPISKALPSNLHKDATDLTYLDALTYAEHKRDHMKRRIQRLRQHIEKDGSDRAYFRRMLPNGILHDLQAIASTPLCTIPTTTTTTTTTNTTTSQLDSNQNGHDLPVENVNFDCTMNTFYARKLNTTKDIYNIKFVGSPVESAESTAMVGETIKANHRHHIEKVHDQHFIVGSDTSTVCDTNPRPHVMTLSMQLQQQYNVQSGCLPIPDDTLSLLPFNRLQTGKHLVDIATSVNIPFVANIGAVPTCTSVDETYAMRTSARTARTIAKWLHECHPAITSHPAAVHHFLDTLSTCIYEHDKGK